MGTLPSFLKEIGGCPLIRPNYGIQRLAVHAHSGPIAIVIVSPAAFVTASVFVSSLKKANRRFAYMRTAFCH